MSESPAPQEPLRATRPAPAAVIVAVLFVVMIGLSIWYLTRREPLVVQGEVQSRTFDLAARVDGRIGQIVVDRSQDVKQGAPLIRIDNPELIAKEQQSEAALRVAEAELARVRARSPEASRADLAVSLPGPLPARLYRSDLPERAADLLEWVWTQTVLPYWPRRRQIMEADIVARTRQLSQGGWAAALSDMRPGMRWLGEGRLQINAHNYPPRKIAGARLLFVPVTPSQGWVSWDMPHRYAVMYPCSGVLAQADPVPVPEALGALLGPARAGVLVLLETPKSTTQLVALTGQGLGSVGRHLKVLLDARLVQRRRAGRSVLYYRTAAGETLLEAQQG